MLFSLDIATLERWLSELTKVEEHSKDAHAASVGPDLTKTYCPRKAGVAGEFDDRHPRVSIRYF
jgi:hypothetical protein